MDLLLIEEMKRLLERLENEHKGYLKALNHMGVTKSTNGQLSQVEAMHVNCIRLRGLIQWLEQGEQVKDLK